VQIIEIGDSSHVEEHSAQIVLARHHVDELRVQRHLDGSQLYEDGVVCYFRQVRRQGFGLDPVDGLFEQIGEDVRPLLHQFYVLGSGIVVLSVHYWSGESIHVLLVRPQQVRFNKLHHEII
jgi:hypothetical protein